MHPFISHAGKQRGTVAVCLPVSLGSGTQPNALANTGAVCVCVCVIQWEHHLLIDKRHTVVSKGAGGR